MNGGFEPVWLRYAVVAAVIVGIVAAMWLFWSLSTTTG
jgi:hypothetical protein